ncbi:unnamed protein product [Caenorhabditis sp. 36 PRJEB53466]|nr:unnamed protein product [Caenorhabditis sp. 36 PRJEB53466]
MARKPKRDGPGKRGQEVVMHFEHPDGFNPTDKIYKTCCCHTKTFTIVMGIFEIFTICFLLVAVLPDVTTRICDKLTNETFIALPLENFELEDIRNVTYVSNALCNNNMWCLLWALVQIMAVNCMFYGMKTIRYWLFIPHFIFRIICIGIIALIISWITYKAIGENADEHLAYIITIIGFSLFELGTLYATWMEIRCAQFVKKSRETGFSISVARPLGPATISLTENQGSAEPPQDRILPPLRGRNQSNYIVQDTPAPQPGLPNGTHN